MLKHRDLMIFNSMSMKKEPLRVTEGEAIRMFVCGPTVQGLIHVGHARTDVFYDVFARYLAHLGFRVNFLMNITDVDDRITEVALEDGKTPTEVARKYTRAFFQDLRRLKVTSITRFESVSKYIDVMIAQVSALLEQKQAYLADGVVYFDTSTYPYYGRLSHQSKSELSLRPLELTPNKKNLLDFALWRPVILEEGKWDSPWGRGSPGWHIEDTAVTLTNFGRQYEIHGGAYELIYPHHEAELAQGESLTGIRPLVRFWVHTGLVNLSGRKMSKSAGNTFLVRKLLDEFSADELRYYLLCFHYREDMEFSLSRLKRASKQYARLVKATKSLNRLADSEKRGARATQRELSRLLAPFYSAMDDDFNTPKALDWVGRELIGRMKKNEAERSLSYKALRVVSGLLGVEFLASS
jgi:cysteinyl-tRNA synthetase